jgi:L-lactate dehydrogenase complex protein LldG
MGVKISPAVRGTEFGDRHGFLARATTPAARDHVENLAHPMPPASLAEGLVPIGYRVLDAGDLVGSFVRNATAALLHVHRLPSATPTDDFLRALIEAESVRQVVTSTNPRGVAVGERLRQMGCEVALHTPELAAAADLGITVPRWAIAATGSLVQDSSAEGGRGASLLPRVHLAIVPTDHIAATTADVLSSFNRRERGMPANVVLISGPSRTGDIEMILTIGVHGPVKVVVAVVDPS